MKKVFALLFTAVILISMTSCIAVPQDPGPQSSSGSSAAEVQPAKPSRGHRFCAVESYPEQGG